MARPKTEHPTPAELEVLKILWDRGPSTVRDVLEEFRARANEVVDLIILGLEDIDLITDTDFVPRIED